MKSNLPIYPSASRSLAFEPSRRTELGDSLALVEQHAPPLADRLAALETRLLLFVTQRLGRALARRVEPADLVQEVYVRLVQAQMQLPPWREGDAELWSYTRTVARHAIVDVARAARAARRDGDPLSLDRTAWSRAGRTPVAPGAGPRTAAQVRELGGRLVEAFRGLSAEHRRVLALRQLEGLSARQTAVRMGRSEAAVHSLFRRALAAWDAARAASG